MSLPAPIYDHHGITLYQGDSREIVPLLERVDLCLADPPYAETNLDWDVWPDGWPAIMKTAAKQMWCFGSLRMFWDYRDEFAGWKLAQDVIWEKHNGSSLHSDRFRRVHETAAHFYQGPWHEIPKTAPMVSIDEERFRERIIRGRRPMHWGGVETGGGYAYDGKRLMRSIIPVRSCHGHAVNETQKPLGLVEPLLRYSVPPGGSVVVPFAGSGTELFMARQLGMRAIGIETRASQCAEIIARLAQEELSLA